jgi:hypothetical protein
MIQGPYILDVSVEDKCFTDALQILLEHLFPEKSFEPMFGKSLGHDCEKLSSFLV